MSKKERYLIGIAAPTNAGKTTLVNELKNHLGGDMSVINFDDYDLYPEGSKRMEEELRNPTISNWEDPALFDYRRYLADLKDLKRGVPVVAGGASRESMAEGVDTKVISPAQFNVAEGVFVLAYPYARRLFDYTYYLDLPEEEMVRRRLARTKAHEMPWDKIPYITGAMVLGTRRYVEYQKRFANVVLDATAPTQDLVKEIIFDMESLSLGLKT